MSRERAIRVLKLAQLIEQAMESGQLPGTSVNDMVIMRGAELITMPARGRRKPRGGLYES